MIDQNEGVVMKNRMHILIPVLVLVLAIAAGDPAQAGIFGKSKQKDTKELTTWRYDRLPSMSFVRGTVGRDAMTDWHVDQIQVHLAKKCRIVDSDGEKARMSDGDEVVIMGPRIGNTVVAWHIRVLDASFMHVSENQYENVQWSEVDRTVGEGTGPN